MSLQLSISDLLDKRDIAELIMHLNLDYTTVRPGRGGHDHSYEISNTYLQINNGQAHTITSNDAGYIYYGTRYITEYANKLRRNIDSWKHEGGMHTTSRARQRELVKYIQQEEAFLQSGYLEKIETQLVRSLERIASERQSHEDRFGKMLGEGKTQPVNSIHVHTGHKGKLRQAIEAILDFIHIR